MSTLSHAVQALQRVNNRGLSVAMAMMSAYLIWDGLPASLWLDVRSVVVFDAQQGEAPKMQIDRNIRRDFDGVYRVEFERQNRFGLFTIIPKLNTTDSVSYNTDARPPADIDLDWWTYPKTVRLDPGSYRIETCWTIKLMLLADRHTCVKSNVFRILPRQSSDG